MGKSHLNYAGTVTVEMAEQDYRNMTVADPYELSREAGDAAMRY